MKEKQIITTLWIAIIFVFGILAVRLYDKIDFNQDTETSVERKGTLRLGLNIPRGTALHAAAERFAERVRERSSGRLVVTVHPNQELGSDNQMLEMARRGELAMLLTPTSKLSTAVPSMQVLDLPFFFPSRNILYKALDGEFGKILLRKLDHIGLVGVTFWENGFKHFTAKQPLHSPEDFKGLRFRIMKSRIIQKQFESLGAKALPIDFHSTRQALADDIVDGQENPLVAIVAMKFHEVQSHMTLSSHAFLGYAFSFSKNRLGELPAEDQNILFDSAREITKWEREETQRREGNFLKTVKQSGVKVYTLSEKEKEAFLSVLGHMPWGVRN